MSSRGVAEALSGAGHFVHYHVIDRLSAAQLADLPGEVVFPVLHGGWGEGGPLQDILEADGRPFVGCGSAAARLAMDKIATKLAAAGLGIPTAPAAVLNANDPALPIAAPAVLKPVHDGSSVGLHVCRTADELRAAHQTVLADQRVNPSRVYMIERAILGGRELTVGILGGEALPPIEIRPAAGVYDYQAKYFRDDTQYVVAPQLPGDTAETIQRRAIDLFRAIGGRHLSRVDFILAPEGTAYLLEVNTMPGFTSHSLVPKAARHIGLDFAALCERLVRMALDNAP